MITLNCRCKEIADPAKCVKCIIQEFLLHPNKFNSSQILLKGENFAFTVNISYLTDFLNKTSKEILKIKGKDRELVKPIYELIKGNPLKGVQALQYFSKRYKIYKKLLKKAKKTILYKKFFKKYEEKGVIIYEEVLQRRILERNNEPQPLTKPNGLNFLETRKKGPYIYNFYLTENQGIHLQIKKLTEVLGLDKEKINKVKEELENCELDYLNMDFNQVIEARKDLAKSLLRFYFPLLKEEELENLSLELAVSNTKVEEIFPLILKGNGITEIYGVKGRNLYIDHVDFGRCQLNTLLTQELINKIETLILTENYSLISFRHPSIKTDIESKYYHSRISYDIPPLSNYALDIRNLHLQDLTIPKLINLEMLTLEAAVFLVWLVWSGTSILITGPTGAGKTTLANSLLPFLGFKKRLISIEDLREIMDLSRFGVLHTAYEIPPFETLNEKDKSKVLEIYKTLWRNPDVVYIGEIRRPEEMEAFLLSLDSGIQTIATVHSSNLEELERKVKRWGYYLTFPESIVVLSKLKSGHKVLRRVSSIYHPTQEKILCSFRWDNKLLQTVKTEVNLYETAPLKKVRKKSYLSIFAFKKALTTIRNSLMEMSQKNPTPEEILVKVNEWEGRVFERSSVYAK